MKKQERKETANKGFSLVELIVVVAIMAVLLVVLTPQYLRYVERTRLQKDNTAIGEIVQTIKIALADEETNADTKSPLILTFTGGGGTAQSLDIEGASTSATGDAHLLAKELAATLKNTYTTSSNTYKAAPDVLQIEVTVTNGIPTVQVKNWWNSVTGPATTQDFN